MPFKYNALLGLGLDNTIPLDGAGKIPSTYLPSYVDDVEEYNNLAAFPATGETGKIYVAIDTGFAYRWSGSVYVQIGITAAAGATTQVQFNDAGAFGGDSGLTFNKTTDALSAGGFIPTSSTVPANGVYLPAANSVGVATNGTGRLFVDASGNVKITSSQYQAIAHKNISADAIYGAVVIGSGSGSQGNISLGFDVSTTTGLNFSGTAQTYFHPNGALIPNNAGTNYIGLFSRDSSDSILLGPATSSGKANGPLTLTSTSVGIGTSGPSFPLHVVTSGNSGLAVYTGTSSANQVYLGNTAGESVVGTLSNQNFGIVTNGGQKVTVTTGGNVGIGSTTFAATSKLQVFSGAGGRSVFRHASGDGGVTIAGSQASSGSSLIFGNTWDTEDGANFVEEYRLFLDGPTDSLAFKYNNNVAEAMRLDSSGRLLVGTSSARANFFNTVVSPQFQIEGAGDFDRQAAIISSSSIAAYGAVQILAHQKSGTIGGNTILASGDALGLTSFQGSDGTEFVEGARIEAFVDGTPSANDLPGRLVFSTTADGQASPTEACRIDSSQSLLVGTTTPRGRITSEPAAGDWGLGVNDVNAGTQSFAAFRYSGTLIGSITGNNTATAYNTSSDYRLKENVVPLTGAADRVNQLQVHRFNFIADPDKTVDGFLAHEAQAVVPECVTGEKDAVDDEGNPEYQGIDQSKLVPLLTAALQEAIGEIESLKARLTAAGL